MGTSTPVRQTVRHAFERAAATYDQASQLQRRICDRLARLAQQWPPLKPPARILDAGCGTGHGLPLLENAFPAATCIPLDLAPAMLKILQRQHSVAQSFPVAADIEQLPLKDGCCDALWSSLAMQWCDPARALTEFARVCHPGGTVWFSTLGPRTFHELRSAFSTLDQNEHTLMFHAPETWRTCAEKADFEILACEQEEHAVYANSLRELLYDIKAIGAHMLPNRKRTLMGRGAWLKLVENYERCRLADGRLPATYDVILLALRKPC